MIKPNLIYSHNWHVQPNCQRSLRYIRLSGSLLDRGPAFRLSCPRTCCARPEMLTEHQRTFLREPSKHIELPSRCQAQSFSSPKAVQLTVGGLSSLANSDLPDTEKFPLKSLALRKISNIDQQTTPEPLVAHRSFLLGLAIACSLWDSLQGFQGLAASPDPTNQHHNVLPTSLLGQAVRPPGGFTAHLQLFKSSTRFSHLQAAGQTNSLSPTCNFPRIATPASECKPAPCGKPLFP
jgi:hypothetical protein